MRCLLVPGSSPALEAKQPVVEHVRSVADRLGATPAQVALAWLLARSPHVVPIPGTRKLERGDENLTAATLELTGDDVRELDDVAATFAVHGGRGTGQEQYG